MEIEVVRQVNTRYRDGRTFSAMPGRRITVDEADKDAVEHFRELVASGDVVEVTHGAQPQLGPVEETEAAGGTDVAPAPTNEELREDLRERGLPTSGNKAELTERLAEDDKAAEAAEAADVAEATAADAPVVEASWAAEVPEASSHGASQPAKKAAKAANGG
jgi:hypothetical protein